MNADILKIGTVSKAVERFLYQELTAHGHTADRCSVSPDESAVEQAVRQSGGDPLILCADAAARPAVSAVLNRVYGHATDSTPLCLSEGTAVGAIAVYGGRQVWLLPSEPENLLPLWAGQLAPRLAESTAVAVQSATVGTLNLSETALLRRLGDLAGEANPAITLIPRAGGETVLHITAQAPTAEQADALCRDTVEDITSRLGAFVYGVNQPNLQTATVQLLQKRGIKVATAESCTAGLLSGKLTQVPGASSVFDCGIAAYSKEIKRDVLGVSDTVLTEQGAVSAETAIGMATGVRRVGGSDIGVGITGEAGPESGDGKPVGTVFVALADAHRVWVKQLNLGAVGRDIVREAATCQALDLIRRYADALPTVMAGGQMYNERVAPPTIPRAQPTKKRRLLPAIFPWKGDRPRAVVGKSALWAGVLAVLVAAALLINSYLLPPERNRKQYVSLEKLYTDSNSTYTADAFPAGMLSRFYALYETNPDVRGWIQIRDTEISYPIVQNADKDYSQLDFSQAYSVYGVPYFDNSVTLTDATSANRSYVVHGNCPSDGQMFSALLKYTDAGFFLNHPTIEMNTLYNTGVFEVFAVLYVDETDSTDLNYRQNRFDTDEDFLQFAAELQTRSLFVTSVRPQADDTLLLLETDAQSSCGVEGIRLIVAARLLPLGESSATKPELSYNPYAKLPARMHSGSTAATSSTTVATTGWQSSDTIPELDFSADLPTDPTESDSTTVTATETAPDDTDNVTTTVGSTGTTTETAPSSAPSTTTATTTATPTTASDGTVAESAFYGLLKVRIGSNPATVIHDATELQYAVACLVKTEMGAARSSVRSLEAQKAQAVAGYTYMLYYCRSGNATFSISSSIDLSNANDRKLYDAVGEVLGVKILDTRQTDPAAMPICAMYSSSSCGVTASVQNVYTATLPYLQSVQSPYDTDEYLAKYGNDAITSTYTISWSDLKARLDAFVSDQTDGAVTAVQWDGDEPLKVLGYDTLGGYVTKTNLYYVHNGRRVTLRGIDIRKAIGSSVLRSHAFEVVYNAETDRLTFTVSGHGHGLGLSQYGAIGYANEAGWTWRQILTHYYSLSDTGRYRIVEPLWD